MMDAVRQWGFALCTAAVACSLAQMLAPKTGASKLFKLTVSTFFLCCIFSPLLIGFGTGEISLTIEEGQSRSDEIARKLEESLSEDYYAPAAEEAGEEVARVLKALGVTPQKIVITINNLDEERIGIYQATLLLEEGDRSREGEITQALRQELGYQAVVEYAPATGGETEEP